MMWWRLIVKHAGMNGKRRVGACWCNGLFVVRQARLASRTHTSLAGLMSRGSGAGERLGRFVTWVVDGASVAEGLKRMSGSGREEQLN